MPYVFNLFINWLQSYELFIIFAKNKWVMYVYNLTVVISDEVFPQWQEWLQNVYLPTINTNKAIERVRVFKVLNVPEKHYAIHHETTSPAQLLYFIEHTIPKLLQQSAESFGEKVLFWGTQLKEVKSEE
ncbi:hypothetical protein HMPREF9072_02410 [Capnocytophaga sp. oral taxon 324 str. F0483]|nr:hypothetical protein HMPREF9072_02410 [Capnocytophaga sp. oral taxon 324 str. F0483]